MKIQFLALDRHKNVALIHEQGYGVVNIVDHNPTTTDVGSKPDNSSQVFRFIDTNLRQCDSLVSLLFNCAIFPPQISLEVMIKVKNCLK